MINSLKKYYKLQDILNKKSICGCSSDNYYLMDFHKLLSLKCKKCNLCFYIFYKSKNQKLCKVHTISIDYRMFNLNHNWNIDYSLDYSLLFIYGEDDEEKLRIKLSNHIYNTEDLFKELKNKSTKIKKLLTLV